MTDQIREALSDILTELHALYGQAGHGRLDRADENCVVRRKLNTLNKALASSDEIAEEVIKLEAENAKLREALAFYADEDSWSPSTENVCPAMIQGEDISSYSLNSKRFVGGQVAREALRGLGLGRDPNHQNSPLDKLSNDLIELAP